MKLPIFEYFSQKLKEKQKTKQMSGILMIFKARYIKNSQKSFHSIYLNNAKALKHEYLISLVYTQQKKN